jgi:hypothetical protein
MIRSRLLEAWHYLDHHYSHLRYVLHPLRRYGALPNDMERITDSQRVCVTLATCSRLFKDCVSKHVDRHYAESHTPHPKFTPEELAKPKLLIGALPGRSVWSGGSLIFFVVSCIDFRVVPEQIFQAQGGKVKKGSTV